MKIRISILFFLLFSSFALFSQEHHRRGKNGNFDPGNPSSKSKKSGSDSITQMFALSASYAYQLPGGDLLYRFGGNSNVGASCFYKSNKNILFGFQWTYLFGNKLKGENPLDSISTSTGYIIDKEGKYADVRIFERGFTLGISVGKVFNSVLSPNKNSGLLLTGGIGYLQHKFRIYDNGARAPQLSKDYLKGYDRLTSGFSTSEFIGYWYISKNRFVNIYSGFEFIQGFTKSRRSWDYNLMRADTENRIDLLSGFRVGWIIPITGRNSHNKYYY